MTLQRKSLSVYYFVGFWLLYFLMHRLLQASNHYRYLDGLLSFSLSTMLIAIAIGYAIWLYKHSTADSRKIFAYLATAYISVFIINLVYQFAYNVMHIPHDNSRALLAFCTNVPYMSFLFFHFLAFASIISSHHDKNHAIRKFFVYIPTTIVITAIGTVLILLVKSNDHMLRLASIYDIAEIILQFCGIAIAITCMVLARNKAIFFLSLSFIIIVAADLIMNLGIMSQTYGQGSAIETAWLLGVLFRIYSLKHFKTIDAYTKPTENLALAGHS